MTTGQPSLLARALLKQLQVDEVPDLKAIASTLGAPVEECDVSSFDGALVRVSGQLLGTIAVRRTIREEGRKNFTIAHELGHFVLPGHGQSVACSGRQLESWSKSTPREELEANEFAGELLVPEGLARKVIGSTEPSFGLIEQIADTFSASLTASLYRFVELTGFRCALVWSEDGIRRWFKASREFAQFLRNGEALDSRSFAHDCFEGRDAPTRPEPVLAGAWLSDPRIDESARILEESRPMPIYGGVLTLLWIKDAIDSPPDEDLEQLEPLAPEDFTVQRKRWPTKR